MIFQVRLAKESKQKSRSHSFDVMNRDKRQFVHELSDHFGIESESYDAEPKRNVVATGKSCHNSCLFTGFFVEMVLIYCFNEFFLLLQLSKIGSGCLLNPSSMWFKDYEKLQHPLLSTQTLNRKSAVCLLLGVLFFEIYYYFDEKF